jgi:hypothetical protein
MNDGEHLNAVVAKPVVNNVGKLSQSSCAYVAPDDAMQFWPLADPNERRVQPVQEGLPQAGLF